MQVTREEAVRRALAEVPGPLRGLVLYASEGRDGWKVRVQTRAAALERLDEVGRAGEGRRSSWAKLVAAAVRGEPLDHVPVIWRSRSRVGLGVMTRAR